MVAFGAQGLTAAGKAIPPLNLEELAESAGFPLSEIKDVVQSLSTHVKLEPNGSLGVNLPNIASPWEGSVKTSFGGLTVKNQDDGLNLTLQSDFLGTVAKLISGGAEITSVIAKVLGILAPLFPAVPQLALVTAIVGIVAVVFNLLSSFLGAKREEKEEKGEYPSLPAVLCLIVIQRSKKRQKKYARTI